MIAPEVLDALLAHGATAEMIVAAVKADNAIAEKAADERRAKDAERQRRHRASRDVTVTNGDGVTAPCPLTPPLKSTPDPTKITPPISPKPNTETRAWALPAGVSLQVWTDFLSNRKRKRLGNTPTAWKSFNDDLNRVSSQTGIPPPKLIEHAAAKGWGSINTPEDQGHGQQRTNGLGRNQPNDGLSPTTRAARDVFGVGASH